MIRHLWPEQPPNCPPGEPPDQEKHQGDPVLVEVKVVEVGPLGLPGIQQGILGRRKEAIQKQECGREGLPNHMVPIFVLCRPLAWPGGRGAQPELWTCGKHPQAASQNPGVLERQEHG